ncbi:hypothetical protein, partial [Cytobacillus oceanisediminis]|uniref:hypothetical protein n=1 Tax=Cytobacillus oceanisediminis TaxID=665099 RepID=UPI0024941239
MDWARRLAHFFCGVDLFISGFYVWSYCLNQFPIWRIPRPVWGKSFISAELTAFLVLSSPLLTHTGIFSAHSSTGLAQFLRFSAINCFFGALFSSFDAYRNIFSAFLNR